jgi:hypothetical protein
MTAGVRCQGGGARRGRHPGHSGGSPVHCPGHQQPNLDRFAAQGTVFKRWYTAAVVCAPSRAALMTGSCFFAATGLATQSPRPRPGSRRGPRRSPRRPGAEVSPGGAGTRLAVHVRLQAALALPANGSVGPAPRLSPLAAATADSRRSAWAGKRSRSPGSSSGRKTKTRARSAPRAWRRGRIVAEHPELAKRLGQELKAWLATETEEPKWCRQPAKPAKPAARWGPSPSAGPGVLRRRRRQVVERALQSRPRARPDQEERPGSAAAAARRL